MGIALTQGRYHLSFLLNLFQIISRVQDEDTRCFGNCFVKNVIEESWDANNLSSLMSTYGYNGNMAKTRNTGNSESYERRLSLAAVYIQAGHNMTGMFIIIILSLWVW